MAAPPDTIANPDDSVTIALRCPDETCRRAYRVAASATSATCPDCGRTITLTPDAALLDDRRLVRCAACGGTEFFIRKDFPQKLGLALVVVFGLTASVFYYFRQVPATFATLSALVLVDAAIYWFVGKVTVCYRCRAEYRGVAYNPHHHGFDLATSEKYDVTR